MRPFLTMNEYVQKHKQPISGATYICGSAAAPYPYYTSTQAQSQGALRGRRALLIVRALM